MRNLYNYIDHSNGKKLPMLSDDVMQIIEENAELLDSTIIYDRDFGLIISDLKHSRNLIY